MSTGPRLVGAAPSLSFAFLSEYNVKLVQLARRAERYLRMIQILRLSNFDSSARFSLRI